MGPWKLLSAVVAILDNDQQNEMKSDVICNCLNTIKFICGEIDDAFLLKLCEVSNKRSMVQIFIEKAISTVREQ